MTQPKRVRRRKNLTLHPDVCEKLEVLSRATGRSQSNLIEWLIKRAAKPKCIALVLGLGLGLNQSHGASVTLGWEPSPDSIVAAYRVFWGTEPNQYRWSQDAGTNLTTTVTNLDEGVSSGHSFRAGGADCGRLPTQQPIAHATAGFHDFLVRCISKHPGCAQPSVRSPLSRLNALKGRQVQRRTQHAVTSNIFLLQGAQFGRGPHRLRQIRHQRG